MPTSRGLYVWDFERRGRQVNVRVDGPLIFNTAPPRVDAALAGLGLALLPEDEVAPHIEAGRLVRVLQDWCPLFADYLLPQPTPTVAGVCAGGRRSSRRCTSIEETGLGRPSWAPSGSHDGAQVMTLLRAALTS
jgi:DNA-binding transcriptional LysR family regulator